jgi:hypothetical protein
MKKASEVAEITKESLDKKAREFIMNKLGPIIIKRAEEGRVDASIDLVKAGMDYLMASNVGPRIKEILENEFDYTAEYSYYSDYRESSAEIKVSWGHAIKS